MNICPIEELEKNLSLFMVQKLKLTEEESQFLSALLILMEALKSGNLTKKHFIP